jgi:hypothetical protein
VKRRLFLENEFTEKAWREGPKAEQVDAARRLAKAPAKI